MILTHLPAPTRDYTRPEPPAQSTPSHAVVSIGADSQVPPYGSAERLHYRPRRQDDFGDGGAVLDLFRVQTSMPCSRYCTAQ